MSDQAQRPWMAFDEECLQLRKTLRMYSDQVKALLAHPHFAGEQEYIEQHSEMKANLMLAYRHLEDTVMRLGKAIQAFDGGKSVYDK